MDWRIPFAKWFVGGTLNVAVNCVDRHVEAGLGDRVAFHWEGEPGDTRTITYADLLTSVCQAANALTELGVHAGDKVAIYMPMVPEAVVAMLACARLGAPHTVVFGGFSSDALRSRILDCDAHFVITADGGFRRGAASVLSPQSTRRSRTVRACAGSSWYDGPARRSRGTRRGMSGGTRSWTASPPPTPPRHSTPSTRSTSCTPAGPPPSPRGSCTRAGATSHTCRRPIASSSTSSPRPTSSGRRPTSAGSPATATSSTGRWRTRRRPSCTKAHPTHRAATGGGRSSRGTRSTSSTRRPPRSVPS